MSNPMRDALIKLSNEVLGSLPLFEPLARREMGNTNYNVLIQRAEEAREIIRAQESDMPKPRGYDTKSFELAEHFLADTPHLATFKRTDELAALIQQTVEDWITHEDSNYEPPSPPGWEGGFADNH